HADLYPCRSRANERAAFSTSSPRLTLRPGRDFQVQATPASSCRAGDGGTRSASHEPHDASSPLAAYFSSSFNLSGLPSQSLASSGASFFSVITGHCFASSALSALNCPRPGGSSSSEKIASAGHSGSHSVQSMHSSGSIARKFGPSWKQSTGHTSTQSMYLHLMQFSVTTKVMRVP